MGGGRFQGGAEEGAQVCVYFEREWYAAGAGFHPALRRGVQGRSEDVQRSELSPAWGRAGERDDDDPELEGARILGGDRDAGGARIFGRFGRPQTDGRFSRVGRSA